MPRSPPSSPPIVNDPATMPESTRDYYRSVWGFDPVADCRILRSGRSRYEECFPLSQDLPLQAVGVTICARVEWEGEAIHNRIMFRRTDAKGRRRKASVKCTHTVAYSEPEGDTPLDILESLAKELMDEISENPRRPVILPPWEHFAALKSYTAGIADVGVITILRHHLLPITNPTDGQPFGFNAGMHTRVEEALFAIAPRAMLSIYRDFTLELLDAHALSDLVDQRINWPTSYSSTAKYKPWKYFLRHLDTALLIYWFRYTGIADEFQNLLFRNPDVLAKAQAIAPDLPWDTLRHEWEARNDEELLDGVNFEFSEPDLHLEHLPPYDVLPRIPFCDYTFPRDILAPDSTSARRSRVQAYLRELMKACSEGVADPEALSDEFSNQARRVSSRLDDILTAPFPADRARPQPPRRWDPISKHYLDLTPAEVVDSIERGDHRRRRNVVLTYPIPSELQAKLTTHWDFATRLALIGNPGTKTSVITTLAQDPQPCVRLAATARLRRGTTAFEPLFGEILDPGEIVWLLSSHPGVFFEFGVTSWGDGSDAYRDWFKAQVREDKRRRYSIGQLYSWVYSEGLFLQDGERGPYGTHLAFCGLSDYACGQLPCLYLGFNVFNPQYGDIQRLEL